MASFSGDQWGAATLFLSLLLPVSSGQELLASFLRVAVRFSVRRRLFSTRSSSGAFFFLLLFVWRLFSTPLRSLPELVLSVALPNGKCRISYPRPRAEFRSELGNMEE